jgi:hypothetical protein
MRTENQWRSRTGANSLMGRVVRMNLCSAPAQA